MGSSGSKKKIVVEGLTEIQKANIFKMFDVRSRERVPPITTDMLQSIWRGVFSDGLLCIILGYLFKTSKEKAVEDLELFFYKMAIGPREEHAELLIGILGVEDSIPPKTFQTYISHLIESYLIILRKKHPEVFSSWVSGDLTEKGDLTIVAKYFLEGINCIKGKIEQIDLENWLSRCGFFKGISDSVMKFAFNMEVEQLTPVLPAVDRSSSLLRVPTALVLSYLTSSFCNKKWRLLYSSSTDGNSWNIVRKKVSGQGPNIVLIQDTDGPLFGGFATHSWKISPKFYGGEDCFLFRLRPEMKVCTATGYNANFQYMNDGSATLPNGMGMGGQINYFGFFLSSDFGQGSVSKTCTTFKDYIHPASQLEFRFIRLEIWGICDQDSQDDDNLKGSELIMERDPTAKAFLEMIGKAGHSSNARASPPKV